MMTEQNKRSGTIVYILYAASCLGCTYGAALLKAQIDLWRSRTFQAIPGTLATYALYAALGLLWAGERAFAGRAKTGVLAAVRGVCIAVLTELGIGWCMGFVPVSYTAAVMPALALLCGYLIVDTVVMIVKIRRGKT